MIFSAPEVAAAQFEVATGWALRPQGLCRGDLCVPLPSAAPGSVDLRQAAPRLGRPLLHDEDHDIWALGPEGGGRFLSDPAFPDLTLADVDGDDFSFSSLRGRKVVMVAWATW